MSKYEELIRDMAYERRNFLLRPLERKELAVIAAEYSDEVIAEGLGDAWYHVAEAIKDGDYASIGALVTGIMAARALRVIDKDLKSARATLDEEARVDAEFA